MNRRNFIAISALAGMTPGQLARVMRGAEPNPSQQDTRNKMWLLKQLLSTPQAGFPPLTPTFAALGQKRLPGHRTCPTGPLRNLGGFHGADTGSKQERLCAQRHDLHSES